jgi:hypothetical protein
MKKMFFTAIALVAFSGVSMANTIADEQVVKENNLIETRNEVLIKSFPCTDAWRANVDCLMGQGLDFETANDLATIEFDSCLCSTYGSC